MADREAKASGKTAPIGLSWGGASSSGGSGTLGREPDLKGVFGSVASKMPAPPPPAGGLSRPPGEAKDAVDLLFSEATPESAPAPPKASEAHASEADELEPMASLFGGGAVPAPKLDPESPSQRPPPPEKRKWQGPAGTRTSLYDDHIRDPMPAAKSSPPPSPAPAVIGALELKSVARAPTSAASEAIASQRPRPLTPPPPPPQAKTSRKPEASAAQTAPQDAREQPAQARKRRVERGPSTLLLAMLTLAALLVLSVASVLLGLVENPFAGSTNSAATETQPLPEAPAVVQPGPRAVQPAPAAPTPEPTKATPAATEPPALAVEPKPAPQPSEAKAGPEATPPAPKSEPSVAVAENAKSAPPEAAPKPDGASEAGANNDEAASALLASARRKLADDDAKGAELVLRQALSQDPQDHHAMEMMARALMEQDRGKDALVYAKKIVQRRPRRVSYRLLLGDVLLMVGNDAGARAEWQEALKLEPNDPQIKRRLGQ